MGRPFVDFIATSVTASPLVVRVGMSFRFWAQLAGGGVLQHGRAVALELVRGSFIITTALLKAPRAPAKRPRFKTVPLPVVPKSIIFRTVLIVIVMVFRAGDSFMPGQAWGNEPEASNLTHPLLPGVRSAEVWNEDWPRTLHDKQITGFSPLVLGMQSAPRIWATLNVGGEANWLTSVNSAAGSALLVNDGRLRLVELDGTVRWTSGVGGTLLFFGDLRGNGRDYVLLGSGPQLNLLDAATGAVDWSFRFEQDHVQVRVAVADLLPQHQGLEAAVFLAYGEEGCLINFPPRGAPEFVWRRRVVEPDEWPERADHGCSIQLDLSVEEVPIIWNVRHHRCRGFDARSGEMVSSLVYPIGGGQRRNYGPWTLGRGPEGQLLACVVAESVQTHVHAIQLDRHGPSKLAWERYYGEVYVVPGVAVENVSMADLDGDGATEMVYNVRDPEADFRSFVRVRDAASGAIQAELADHWCAGAFFALGEAGRSGLLVYEAAEGATPEEGDLLIYAFDRTGQLQVLDRLVATRPWGVYELPSPRGNQLLLHRRGEDEVEELVLYELGPAGLRLVGKTRAVELLEKPLRQIIDLPGGERLFFAVGARGTLEALDWRGRRLWELPLEGGAPATLSAADLNRDGRAELAAACVGDRVRVFEFDEQGEGSEIGNYLFLAPRQRQSPLLYDLEGKGELCLIAPGRAAGGLLAVRAWRSNGSLLWERVLDSSTADQGLIFAWNAGEFLPGQRPALAISVRNGGRTVEGTYLLDGPTGEVVWFVDFHREGDIVRGFVPAGLPGAFDFDGDGIEEINMDMYSYMAMVRGVDASFAFIKPTTNISSEGALYAAQLYNSFCPLYEDRETKKPHWFSPLGHGIFGLMNPDPTTGTWREELGYDTPPKAGLVDVDGDGVLEVGYAALNSTTFICRNLWTGEVKWELPLPSAPNGPVISADVDGDGKGEFLLGTYCIGTDAAGRGEIRWRAPVDLGWAIIADFDGDGQGEIACAAQGKIHLLKGDGGG